MDSDSDSSNENEILPRRSRRLSTIIPASHWMSIGYLPREAEEMENLMIDMDRYREEFEDGIDFNVKLESGYPDMVVPYHETMLPLWKRFSKALMINNEDEDFDTLDINSISMDIHAARLLSDAIMYNHPRLKKVKLQQCGLSNTSLLQTFLAGCSRIETIALEDNEIGSEGALVIAEFISDNHPVKQQVIRLANNNISDGDMVAFASALKLNTHLFLVDLIDNDITDQGWNVIQNAVFDTRRMNALVDCNHTCVILRYYGDEDDDLSDIPILEREVIVINGDIDVYTGEILPTQIPVNKKIRKKVVLALCKQNQELFDLSYLNDLPLQLMPRVLELIQEHSLARLEEYKDEDKQLETDALSRLFHILRAWQLPLLFDNLHGVPTHRSKRRRKGSSR